MTGEYFAAVLVLFLVAYVVLWGVYIMLGTAAWLGMLMSRQIMRWMARRRRK